MPLPTFYDLCFTLSPPFYHLITFLSPSYHLYHILSPLLSPSYHLYHDFITLSPSYHLLTTLSPSYHLLTTFLSPSYQLFITFSSPSSYHLLITLFKIFITPSSSYHLIVIFLSSLSHLSHLPPLSFPFCFKWGKIKESKRKSEKGERRALFSSLKTAGIEECRRDRNRGRYGNDSLLFLRLLSRFLYC